MYLRYARYSHDLEDRVLILNTFEYISVCYLFFILKTSFRLGCLEFSGDLSGGVTPDSIPNSEVKSSCADGTAGFPCGRVGHRRVFFSPV